MRPGSTDVVLHHQRHGERRQDREHVADTIGETHQCAGEVGRDVDVGHLWAQAVPCRYSVVTCSWCSVGRVQSVQYQKADVVSSIESHRHCQQ